MSTLQAEGVNSSSRGMLKIEQTHSCGIVVLSMYLGSLALLQLCSIFSTLAWWELAQVCLLELKFTLPSSKCRHIDSRHGLGLALLSLGSWIHVNRFQIRLWIRDNSAEVRVTQVWARGEQGFGTVSAPHPCLSKSVSQNNVNWSIFRF